MERLCVAKEGPGRGGDTGVMDTLAVDELVSMEWSEVQDDDSESCDKREKSGYAQLHAVGGGEQQGTIALLLCCKCIFQVPAYIFSNDL